MPTSPESNASPAESSPQQSSVSARLPFWANPEPLVAVIGAILLRWYDKLEPQEVTWILVAALGASPVVGGLMRVARKMKASVSAKAE